MKYLVLILMVMVTKVHAHGFSFDNYLKTQEALAADDFKSALSAHQNLCSNELKVKHVAYQDCGKKFKDIGELRESFKAVTKIFATHGSTMKRKGIIEATCPMAKANWFQKEGSIANPYYGKSMLECGEKI